MLDSDPSAIGPYDIVEVLGFGGGGVVYKGCHRETGELVAIKTLHAFLEDRLSHLRWEIHALARLRHPRIVRIVDHGIHGDVPWYAMDCLEGATLRRYSVGLWQAALGALQEWEELTDPEEMTLDVQFGTREWWTLCLPSRRLAQLLTAPFARTERLPGVAGAENGQRAQETMTAGPRLDSEASGSGEPTLTAPSLSPGDQGVARPSEASEADQDLPRRRIPGVLLNKLLDLALKLCPPLAFLHGEGMVHCDFKPENILISPSGEPVLVDFGLLSLSGGPRAREVLRITTQGIGTAPYMAPEQIRGELPDARADLYALGCILYEMFTRRRPFRGRTVEDLLGQQLHEMPHPPGEIVEGLPRELDELILGLLAKRPQDRIGHADQVAAVFRSLGGRDAGARAQPPVRAALYRSGFVGRTEELSAVRMKLDKLMEGRGSLVLIHGESGSGKTRFAMKLARQAKGHRIQVLTGESDAPAAPAEKSGHRGGAPLEALRPILRAIADRCHEKGPEETRRLLGKRLGLLAQFEPALARLPGAKVPARSKAPDSVTPSRVHRSFFETLAALAEKRPLLMILDDLQWADELTLGFLQNLLQEGHLEETRLLVLGAYRSEEASPTIQRLASHDEVLTLRMGDLNEEAISTIVREMLAMKEAPVELVRYLAHQSEGNPFFVAEYLHAAVETGLLVRGEGGSWKVAGDFSDGEARSEIDLPESLVELVGRRLDALPKRAVRVAQAAAVLGREFEAKLLGRVTRKKTKRLGRALQELFRRHVLQSAGASSLRFVHDKIREVAYGGISAKRRRKLHRRAAEALEERQAHRQDAPLAVLGQHWEEANDPVRARTYYLAGARQARHLHAYGEAEQLYHNYLRLVDEPNVRSVDSRNDLARDILYAQGRNPEAIEQHEIALREAVRLGDLNAQAQCLRGLATVYRGTGQLDKASKLAHQALQIYRQADDIRLQGRTLAMLAGIAEDQGRIERAEELYRAALALHREARSPHFEAITLSSLGLLFQLRGKFLESRSLQKAALEIHRMVGNRRSEAITLELLGSLAIDEQKWTEARQLLEQALNILKDIGNRRFEAIAMGRLALVDFAQGRLPEARALLSQSLGLLERAGNRLFWGRALRDMARLERLGRANLGDAARLLQRAEGMFDKLENALELALCICERGHLALAGGETARSFIGRARELCASVGLGSASQPGRAIGRLERADNDFRAGRPLIRGDIPFDLPDSLRHFEPKVFGLANSGGDIRNQSTT